MPALFAQQLLAILEHIRVSKNNILRFIPLVNVPDADIHSTDPEI